MSKFTSGVRDSLNNCFQDNGKNKVDTKNQYVIGENGHEELSVKGFNNNLLAFSDKLVRNCSEDIIQSFVDLIVKEAKEKDDVDTLKQLFLLAFQTRNCRGGKGEKKVFYRMIKCLYKTHELVVLELIDLIPHYGYWKDLFLLLEVCSASKEEDEGVYESLYERVWQICVEQHVVDLETSRKEGKKEISLYAKYVPSENSSLDKKLKVVSNITKRLYGDGVNDGKKKFRQEIASLRKATFVVERLMCGGEYSKISFDKVPSKALKQYTLAFLNEQKNGEIRHADVEDRTNAREKFMDILIDKGVKGKQLQPHELVTKASVTHSAAVKMVLEKQWETLRNGVIQEIEERKKFLESTADGDCSLSPACDISKIVVMSDVSASMYGTPMEVSIAFGILISEITHKAFRDIFLTFHTVPTWHDLSKCKTFTEKVASTRRAAWGGSTNFYGAMEKIGEQAIKNSLSEDEIPDLLVVSDMQFNMACSGNWGTAHSKIVKYFEKVGNTICGKPYQAPKIIFWNVRASAQVGFVARPDTPGVLMLSGFSPSLLKFIFSGETEVEDIQIDEDTGEVKKVKRKLTAAELFQKVLQDPTLDKVRERLDEIPEYDFLKIN